MKPIVLQQPKRIAFGDGVSGQCIEDLRLAGYRHAFIVSSSPLRPLFEDFASRLQAAGLAATLYPTVDKEPDIALFNSCLAAAREARPDCVVGLGGGSALDVAKLVAALFDLDRPVADFFGIGLLPSRHLPLFCLPTTSGTGSEVSPNAILLHEQENLKKGVVSPHLMPDAAYVDPVLTWSVPRGVTAATGIDAMTHCIEAYANLFAHPTVDLYALEGIRRIARSLETALDDPRHPAARADLALGSLYGGLCLGPVNTAAVHALAYPLGSEFHVAHGVSNAILLPHVLRFNLDAAPERYAAIALACGVDPGPTPLATAEAGIGWLFSFVRRCGIPQHMAEFGVRETDLPGMAAAAMKVTRLLKNNPKPLTASDAESIYRAAF